MKLTMLNVNYTFENTHDGLQSLIDTINRVISNEDLFFSHLTIDGLEIYNEHEEYILDNISDIKDVQVNVKSIKEFVGELLVSLNTYTEGALPEIELLVKDFYQTPSDQSWVKLNQFLEGIDWIYATIKGIDEIEHTIAGWDEFLKSAIKIEVQLPSLLEAIENKDTILIADLIQYEILPELELLNDETKKYLESK